MHAELNPFSTKARTTIEEAMSNDTILLPSDLQATELRLYRGTWRSEIRQPADIAGQENGVLREIWVRLPSGKDRKWQSNEPIFSALPGHQVGVLAYVDREGTEYILGMVNYSTGEKRMFWLQQPRPIGRKRWLPSLFLLIWFDRTPGFILWLAVFAATVAFTIWVNKIDARDRVLDQRRLDHLTSLGASEFSEGDSPDVAVIQGGRCS